MIIHHAYKIWYLQQVQLKELEWWICFSWQCTILLYQNFFGVTNFGASIYTHSANLIYTIHSKKCSKLQNPCLLNWLTRSQHYFCFWGRNYTCTKKCDGNITYPLVDSWSNQWMFSRALCCIFSCIHRKIHKFFKY